MLSDEAIVVTNMTMTIIILMANVKYQTDAQALGRSCIKKLIEIFIGVIWFWTV